MNEKILRLKSGDTFYRICYLRDKNNSPIDITDYEIRLQARRGYDSTITLFSLSIDDGVSIVDALGGVFDYTVSATDTALFPVGKYLMDIEITNEAGRVSSSETFTLEILRDITR